MQHQRNISSRAAEAVAMDTTLKDKFINENHLVLPKGKKADVWEAGLLYFSTDADKKDRFYCIECLKGFKNGGGNTTAARSHLVAKHKEKWQRFLSDKAAKDRQEQEEYKDAAEEGGGIQEFRVMEDGTLGIVTSSSTAARSVSSVGASSSVTGMGKGNSSGGRAAVADDGLVQGKIQQMYTGERLYRIHKALVAFLILDMRPFSLIEGKGFRQFLHVICPQYKVTFMLFFFFLCLLLCLLLA